MANDDALTFLIVDEDASDVTVLKSLLEGQREWKIECLACDDPEECAKCIRERSIDMAFLSYRTDARVGFAFLRALRAANAELPIVILTARGDEHITAEIIRGGANDYLAKADLSAVRARRIVEQLVAQQSRQREEKLAEATLRLNMQNYRTLINNIPDIVLIHRDGQILFANQAAETVLGYTEAEVVGKMIFTFMPNPDDKEKVKEAMQRRSSGEDVAPYEVAVRDKKGNLHTVIVRASRTIFNDKPAFQVVLVDITERKRAEEELLKAHKLESLGILAGGIAHDFNNILTGIVAGVAAAKMKVRAGSEVYELLEEVEKASFKASELTHELLTFSQGGEPVREPTSIRELIEQISGLSVRGTNVTFRLELPTNLLNVVIDKSQISQVLSNLFINAAQAMPGGGEIVVRGSHVMVGNGHAPQQIEVSRLDETLPLGEGLYVRIDVRDSGMGIPQSNIEKIFDPYFTTKSGGTGLGLATVYSVLQKHNGHITVDSRVGKGTTFSFFLPATLEMSADDIRREKATAVHAHKILVMDDDETILFTLRKFLTALGYTAVCVPDGAKALKAYREASEAGEPFSAVLMDLTIHGGLGGKETVGHMLELDPSAKVIVISGYSDDPILANYREYGFSGVLKKPFRPEQLECLLKEVAPA